MNPKIIFSLLVILFVVIFDQGTKALAIKSLPTVCNFGFAFGVWQGVLNGLVASLVLLALIWAFLAKREPVVYASLALIIGGGASNILDRLNRGCVVDFIDFGIWPAFNVADVAISLGTVILILSLAGRKKT